MAIFVIYQKDSQLKILQKSAINTSEIENLAQRGFVKINMEIQASSRQDAVKKLTESIHENTAALGEFGKDIAFSSLIESLLR